MSTGQQLLALGALILFSIFMLRVYNTETSNIKNSNTNQAIITATALGQALLEQIQTESFDQNTVPPKSVSTPDSLTPLASLGKDPGETTPTTFNDVDDFNNYTEADTMGILGVFNLSVTVSYCTKMNPDLPSAVRTFSKRVDVGVYNKNLYLTDTLKLSKVISYY